MIESKDPQQLKAIAIRNTWSTIPAYFIPICLYGGLALWLELTSVSYLQFIYLFIYTVIFAVIIVFFIRRLKGLKYEDGFWILFVQVANWYLCYGLWIILLENGRPGGLIFAMMMFIYTYSYTNIRKTVIGNLLVATIYLSCSYYTIYHLNIKGNFLFDLYLVIAYLPVGIIIAKVGGQMAQHRFQLKRLAKEQKLTQQELQVTLGELEKIASTDDLTGLLNRREMNNRLQYEFKKLKRSELVLAVLLLDLDHFKLINDEYGHQVGDQVLKQIANLLQHEFRETDSIGRWGGEEFLVLMPESDRKQAKQVAERVLQKLNHNPINYAETLIAVTASGGICELRREGNVEKAIRIADDNLYKAKAAGRNKIIAE